VHCLFAGKLPQHSRGLAEDVLSHLHHICIIYKGIASVNGLGINVKKSGILCTIAKQKSLPQRITLQETLG
jgi:hypothetical protein